MLVPEEYEQHWLTRFRLTFYLLNLLDAFQSSVKLQEYKCVSLDGDSSSTRQRDRWN